VIASSDDAELCDTCDRILVMRDGRIVAEVDGERATPEDIARLQLGSANTPVCGSSHPVPELR
jgi:ribose transport system ATP-binding protein